MLITNTQIIVYWDIIEMLVFVQLWILVMNSQSQLKYALKKGWIYYKHMWVFHILEQGVEQPSLKESRYSRTFRLSKTRGLNTSRIFCHLYLVVFLSICLILFSWTSFLSMVKNVAIITSDVHVSVVGAREGTSHVPRSQPGKVFNPGPTSRGWEREAPARPRVSRVRLRTSGRGWLGSEPAGTWERHGPRGWRGGPRLWGRRCHTRDLRLPARERGGRCGSRGRGRPTAVCVSVNLLMKLRTLHIMLLM